MSAIDGLLDSYLDLARLLDPLRHPYQAPASVRHALGRFDPAWVRAQLAALRAIANAVEDLEDVNSLDDEVDRTMLINTIRADIHRLEAQVDAPHADPVLPLGHAVVALRQLMSDRFGADDESALRARLGALPELLDGMTRDTRPVPAHLIGVAALELDALGELLDEASERLDETAAASSVAAVERVRSWLLDPARAATEPSGDGEARLDAILATMVSEPVGARGVFRILELRRAGVEALLAAAAADVGSEPPLELVRTLREQPLEIDELDDTWADEWHRVGDALRALGLDVPECERPGVPAAALDSESSLAAHAVRSHAASILDAARAKQLRPVRRLLVAPGLMAGFGRTVAALVKPTDAVGSAERRLMLSHRALVESVAAEVDLLLQSGAVDLAALQMRVEQATALDASEARELVLATAAAPFQALAAALAHEGWQGWYAEEGGDPVAFVRRAAEGGGLSVPLARWALTAPRDSGPAVPDGLI